MFGTKRYDDLVDRLKVLDFNLGLLRNKVERLEFYNKNPNGELNIFGDNEKEGYYRYYDDEEKYQCVCIYDAPQNARRFAAKTTDSFIYLFVETDNDIHEYHIVKRTREYEKYDGKTNRCSDLNWSSID